MIAIGVIVFLLSLFLDRDNARGRYWIAVWRGALAAYVFFILAITLLTRRSFGMMLIKPIPLWSWYHVIINVARWYYVKENILNIILFVPYGFLAGVLWRIRAGRALLIGVVSSFVIEILQLVTHRGYFEWDDMIHNMLGFLIGVLVINAVRRKTSSGIGGNRL